MEGVLAVVTNFAADFAPKYWQFCNGQILAIAQNQALFSLLGTTFGGNGVTTFALPDMRSRVQVGVGSGSTFNYVLGEVNGSETTTLTIANMPAHTHNGNLSLTMDADNTGADSNIPDFGYPSVVTNGYAASASAGVNMAAPTVQNPIIGVSGGSQPFQTLSPYIAINYIICVAGIFPSRN